MAIKFDPTISLGNILTAIVVAGAALTGYGTLQAVLATHTVEIKQLQDAGVRHDNERVADRVEIRDLVKEVKMDVKDLKDAVIQSNRGRK